MSEDLFRDQIPFLKPWVGEEEAAAVTEVVLSGWFSMGPKTAEFESAIAERVGARHAVATNAATSALHLALRVAGVEPGDEVLCPAFTCMATVNAVLLAGAAPVFADVDPRTWNLDPADAAERLGPRTRAVLVVDQIGQPADLDAFRELCRRHDLLLLEDAATALGGRYKGRPVGGAGVPACFSFHPRKIIATGEGGMLVTDDAEQAERARVLRSTGASISDLVRHRAKGALLQEYLEAGYNYRLTDMQAALGLVQLRRLPEILRQRRQQAAFYTASLAAVEEVEPPHVPAWAEPAWSSYCVRLRPGSARGAAEVVRRLAAQGISCRHGIQPLHLEPVFREAMAGLSLPASEAAARETLFLPIFPGLGEAAQTRVIDALTALVRGA